MGLFDRIKKAFTGKDDEEEKKQEAEKATGESTEDTGEVSSDQQESKTEDASTDKATEDEQSGDSEAGNESDSQSESSNEDASTDDTVEEKQESEDESIKEPESNVEPEVSEKAEEKSAEDETVTDESTNDSSSEKNPEVEGSESTEPTEETSDEESETDTDSEKSDEEESEEKDVKEYDEGLKKSRNSFSARFNRFLANFRSVDEDFFDDLEELLIESDVGYETAMRISDELREEVKLENVKKRSDVSDVIVRKLVDMYDEEGKEEDNSLKFSTDKTPTVFLFVGVNGAGKTTTIGKLAHRYQQEGKKVLLAAGDTFRAGAIEQLQEWGRRVNVPVEASKPQTDPASVVYDAVQRAINEDFDILLVDTAGRLQNKEGLMRELEKIKRVITRELPESPQEVLLVLDGSTGQNALSQAKQFNETTNVSGIVLTKIDGSSQGGIVLAIRNELHLPVKLVGLGEQMDDLRDFDPEKFIYGLFKELIIGSGK
ncbi:signal recognition particle-docking protein FtsY [Companilactobacillus hulinensis]|uniref:signal recognition particle-docking protein FtsY n=1 Tax=Companilactobacillus hulinensis TaxID=2486007 RepID=UPI000F7AE6AE|nr:signal recognition particle-docking protein FtsY [Companilactobacillus hulinensis]